MPRYFFDLHDGRTQRDNEGTELADNQAAARYAKKLLPEIAAEEVLADGEHHTLTVLVTDEDGRPVYSAAISYAGIWLTR
ncbi:hypothetical protein [Methylobacterium sp. Leaf469]|uniref:DUF6894 family protein n=1 Tax=Methylobacterium sp. Leaf469 TaxID=1736387 RepID=UPI0009E6870D|nr:hypothetical protein [Methylobacterium sp. Leaf469]